MSNHRWQRFKLHQADVTKLMDGLKFAIKPKPRKFAHPAGPEGRLMKFRLTLTALLKHERIELNYHRADEARGYIERVRFHFQNNSTNINLINPHQSLFQLISDAIRYGDRHKHTMEMADYWILEKQYVHKLFKVLVPRFENLPISYTRMYKAPLNYPCHGRPRAVLELRGNPFPPLVPDQTQNRNLLHNVLLDAAKKEFREAKYAEIAEKLAPQAKDVTSETVVDSTTGSADEKDAKKKD